MSDIRSFRDVIELWPSLDAMASDVSVPTPTIAKWRQRDSIPAQRWSAVLSTDTAKVAGLTSDTLTVLAAREEARA